MLLIQVPFNAVFSSVFYFVNFANLFAFVGIYLSDAILLFYFWIEQVFVVFNYVRVYD